MNADLRRERAYYEAHLPTLAQLYDGQFVVIKGDTLLAAYDDAAWATAKSKKRYGGGAFFVQKVGAVAAPAR